MLQLKELKKNRELINQIDWGMTPEQAVILYLEWGNNDCTNGKYAIRSKNDFSYYFVINTWGKIPKIFLIKRNSDEAKELAEFEMPENVKKKFLDQTGNLKGVYSVEGDVKNWLQDELEVDDNFGN